MGIFRDTVASSVADTESSARRRLGLSYSVQTLNLLLRAAEQLLLVPFFITSWGTVIYRDWLVLFSLAGFVPLADMGMTFFFQNVLRKAWAGGSHEAFERILEIRLFLYLCLILVAGPLLLIAGCAFIYLDLIEISIGQPAGMIVLFFLVLRNLLSLVQYYFTGIYLARDDYHRSSALIGLSYLVGIVLTVGALRAGAGPETIAILYLMVMSIFGCGTFAVDQAYRYPDIHYAIALPTRRELRDIFVKSLLFWVPYVGLAVHTHASVLMLGQLSTASAAVVTFTVSRTLTGMIRLLAEQFGHASGVEMGRQAAQGKLTALRSLAQTTGRLISGLVGLSAGGMLVLAEPAIRIWTSGKVAYDPWLIGALLITVILVTPAQVGYVALHYTNRPIPIAVAFLVRAGGGLLLSMFLIPSFGAVGAALGMGLAEVVSIGGFLSVVGLRSVRVPIGRFAWDTYGTAVLALMLGSIVAALLDFMLRPDSLVEMMLLGVSWLIIVAAPAVLVWRRHKRFGAAAPLAD